MNLFYEHEQFLLYAGNSEEGVPIGDTTCDALICDPPSSIKFMGQEWDSDKGGRAQWVQWLECVMKEALRVLKPGAYGTVWALPRRSHWTALALENAGFEIRDIIYHFYAEGFPKNLDVSKKIDDKLGAVRKVIGVKNNTYDGATRNPSIHSNPAADSSFGTWGLKKTPHGLPLTEPTTPEAKQWAGWGTALKPAVEHWILVRKPLSEKNTVDNVLKHGVGALNIDAARTSTGRFPAHLIHDGTVFDEAYGKYFYAAKPGKKERNTGCTSANEHPTVKSLALMRYLTRLITPAQGIIIDLFAGSGTTGVAALLENFAFIGVENQTKWLEISRDRLLFTLKYPNA